MPQPLLLEVKNLNVAYLLRNSRIVAANRLSFSIGAGESLAVVGESGSGKSTLAKALLRVLEGNARFSGEVWFEGKSMFAMPERMFSEHIRWKKISWVPQDTSGALNPVFKAGDQIAENLWLDGARRLGLRLWQIRKRRELGRKCREEAGKLLKVVGLSPEDYINYPHQLSGGQKQRVLIAKALALNPALIILDEPTSALDVSLQGQIVHLLEKLQEEFHPSYIFITHNIGIAGSLCDRMAVMYGGHIVELGPADKVEYLKNPLHPYTRKLIECAKSPGAFIPGEPPDLRKTAKGCPFWSREAVRCQNCSKDEAPQLVEKEPGHFVACHGVAPPR